MRAAIFLCLALVGGSCLAAPPDVLTATVSLAEWGIDDPAALRFGRLSVVERESGAVLLVYDLRLDEPRADETQASVRPLPWTPEDACFVIADFTDGNRNRLGGTFNVFQRLPSSAGFDLDRRPHGRRTLQLTYHRDAEGGFCGFWMHFWDLLPHRPRTFLDPGEATHLQLWVRGREGGEEILLKVADARLHGLDDALPVGDLAQWTAAGRLTPAWQLAAVPLDALPDGLDRGRLASLALEAVAGDGAIELGPVAFCRSGASPEPPAEEPDSAEAAERRLEKSLWVWETRRLLEDTRERSGLLDYLSREDFTRIYLQLPNTTGEPARIGDDSLRPLIGALHGLGLEVRALDGHATFVEPKKQDGVLGTVGDVIAYNARVDPGERFDGVHYDVEPYLLPGFGGPRRVEILERYVDLVARLSAAAHEGGLEVGVDLPFWYDEPDEITGRTVQIDHGGTVQGVVEHVLDHVDDVTLMDYRTLAFGPDGVLYHAAGELAAAADRGKTVSIGLEVGALPDEVYVTFTGPPRVGLPSDAGGDRVVLTLDGDAASFHLVAADRAAEPDLVPDAPAVLSWPVARRIAIPSSKVTFAPLGSSSLDAVVRQVRRELASRPSFGGIAIHYYSGLSELTVR